MKKTHLIIIGIVGIVAAALLINAVYVDNTIPTSSAALFSTKTNSEGNVSVMATPIDQSDWSFEITLNTHSVDINEDLAQVSTLTDENGNEYKPIEWRGDPPGGHHRKGVLSFGEITPRPQSITLFISQIGGIDERKFEWITQP
ncbi:MAG TPA: hypothetical protein ENH86_00955 [Candidatus Jorgensenbacteria bacterium]|uniref:Uncharacterized protein n=1 Tax=marine sediment metagenome TaxID=412755 RepID=A0A0F9GY04_9ZZZZ|nr:hypothetical protein [Candidatus Jorgensenbacteria bacterium]